MSKPILVRTWNKRFCYNDIAFDFFKANRDKTNQDEELVEDDNNEDMNEDEIADKVVSSKFVTTVLLMYSLFQQYDKNSKMSDAFLNSGWHGEKQSIFQFWSVRLELFIRLDLIGECRFVR